MGNSMEILFHSFLLSLVPVSEIRGAMIYGVPMLQNAMGEMDFISIGLLYMISVIGNFLPVPLIMLLFRPLVKWLKTTRLFSKPAHWLEKRTHRKAKELKRVSFWGLMIFVAIPLPTTGAWTGAMIASLLDMRFKYALPAILAGIMIAGVIMMLLMTGVLNLGVLGQWLTSN